MNGSRTTWPLVSGSLPSASRFRGSATWWRVPALHFRCGRLPLHRPAVARPLPRSCHEGHLSGLCSGCRECLCCAHACARFSRRTHPGGLEQRSALGPVRLDQWGKGAGRPVPAGDRRERGSRGERAAGGLEPHFGGRGSDEPLDPSLCSNGPRLSADRDRELWRKGSSEGGRKVGRGAPEVPGGQLSGSSRVCHPVAQEMDPDKGPRVRGCGPGGGPEATALAETSYSPLSSGGRGGGMPGHALRRGGGKKRELLHGRLGRGRLGWPVSRDRAARAPPSGHPREAPRPPPCLFPAQPHCPRLPVTPLTTAEKPGPAAWVLRGQGQSPDPQEWCDTGGRARGWSQVTLGFSPGCVTLGGALYLGSLHSPVGKTSPCHTRLAKEPTGLCALECSGAGAHHDLGIQGLVPCLSLAQSLTLFPRVPPGVPGFSRSDLRPRCLFLYARLLIPSLT